MNQRFRKPIDDDDVEFFVNEYDFIDLTKDQFERLAYHKMEKLSGLANSWGSCLLVYQDLKE